MLSFSSLNRFFVLVVFVTCLHKYQTNGTNVTFIPEPIHITVDDLPDPFATASVSKGARVIPVPDDPVLYVPDGFTVKLYMSGFRTPRYLLYTPTGDILVSEPNANRISCLIDIDGDGYPDESVVFADSSNGINRPYGMAFIDGYFYVGNQNATRRYSWIRGSRQISGTGELVMTYQQSGHWTRTVVVSPTADSIYVSIGSASNVNAEPLPRASIQLANLDGSNATTFAHGLRNPIGLAFHPITQDLYVACQERDLLGDDLVPDFFTRVEQDDYYGWPFAYMTSNLTDPRRCLENGTSERPDLVSLTKTPDVLFQAHSAVLDSQFYTGNQFPTRYRNGAFAALHGSWNKNNGTGYKIVFIPFDDSTNRPLGYYEDFVYGFLTDPSGPDTFGRPVGLLVLKDGSLLFTEDGNNRIYQVQYNVNSTTTTTTPTNQSNRLLFARLIIVCSFLFSFLKFFL
jgi:glucose/arabinose dehydrogenase